jgi:iron-sulfur cluster repair protein YtfE (RIC family)
MSKVTGPLRDEHASLAPRIEGLRAVADSVGEAPPLTLRRRVDKAYDFLRHDYLPHALAEEQVLYPTVGKIFGTPLATTTMSCDNAEISRLVRQLDSSRGRIIGSAFDTETANDLRRVLYCLHGMIKTHLAKEEEVYFPMLDTGLSEELARALFHNMAQIVHDLGGTTKR